jgi:uncharacterized membrane protein YfcA
MACSRLVVILLCAGVLAGIVGTAGAITSLVSYPALIAVGVAPLAAGVANIVALTMSWPGSALASRRELVGQGGWLRRYAPVAAAGGAIGTTLLLSTPAGVFASVVPFLVLVGSLALLVSPWLTSRRRASAPDGYGVSGGSGGRDRYAIAVAVLVISIYNGYFGAGAGVMLLALCLVTADDRLPTANALKNMLVGAATIAAAIGLVCFGRVDWSAVVPLGIGEFAGSLIGPRVTRRLPPEVLRPLVAAVAVGLAVQLWLSHGA